ncbi:Tmem43, partial [Symbiodinium necroappetens]
KSIWHGFGIRDHWRQKILGSRQCQTSYTSMRAIIAVSLILPAYADGQGAVDLHIDAPVESVGLLQEHAVLQEHLSMKKSRDISKGRLRPGHMALHPEVTGFIQKAQQEPDVTVEHQSWFSRLGDAFWSVIAGLCLIPFSLALMWMNERRNAQQESILQLGMSEVQTIASKSVDEKLHGTLVHMNDADAQGMDEMKDRRFPALRMESGCLRMRSQVQVYQWKETKKQDKKKDSLGGGETTVTHYEYSKIWSDTQIDSTSFHQPSHSNSISIAGLQCGTEKIANTTVKYGDGYYLPKDLVEQLNNWKSANSQVKILEYNGTRFGNPSEGWLYSPESAAQSPTVGSVRVCLEYVTDGPVSIVALQSEDDKHPRAASFLPYRLVSRGLCCGLRDEALQSALLTQGRKNSQELYEEEAWTSGPFACLCCCCNLIARLFAALAPPQIFAAYPGHSTVAEVFDKLTTSGLMVKWGVRLLSWVLLYAGTYALFQPLLVVLDILPFLGPYISSGAGWVIGLVVFLATAILATLVISVAFLRYHPLVGLTYVAGVGIIVLATIGIMHWLA